MWRGNKSPGTYHYRDTRHRFNSLSGACFIASSYPAICAPVTYFVCLGHQRPYYSSVPRVFLVLQFYTRTGQQYRLYITRNVRWLLSCFPGYAIWHKSGIGIRKEDRSWNIDALRSLHCAQTKITILFLLHMILESDFSTRSNDLWRCGLTDCGLCESCELRLRVLQITNCNSRFLVIASSSRHSFSSRGGLILRVDWNPFTRLLHFHSTLGIDSSLIGWLTILSILMLWTTGIIRYSIIITY